MTEIVGIKCKIANQIFLYHLTGFGHNYIYYGHANRLVIANASEGGEIISDLLHEGELYYDDFIALAKSLHLRLIEEQLTAFSRIKLICQN